MSFSPFNWIRDAFGIKHDIVTAEKTNLEIEKLKEEQERSQSRITLATLDEVKEYDPKLKKLLAIIALETTTKGFIGGLSIGPLALLLLLPAAISLLKDQSIKPYLRKTAWVILLLTIFFIVSLIGLLVIIFVVLWFYLR